MVSCKPGAIVVRLNLKPVVIIFFVDLNELENSQNNVKNFQGFNFTKIRKQMTRQRADLDQRGVFLLESLDPFAISRSSAHCQKGDLLNKSFIDGHYISRSTKKCSQVRKNRGFPFISHQSSEKPILFSTTNLIAARKSLRLQLPL